jgi:hypothetical protein
MASKFYWGVEAFWLAYMAAFPEFPNGIWPNWNPVIDVDGDCIQDWFRCFSQGEGATRGLYEVWEDFQSTIAHLDN